MLEIVAAAGLVAGVVMALTRTAPPADSHRVPPRRAPVSVGAGYHHAGWHPESRDDRGQSHYGSDLPCPWCRAATSENDRRCPSCGQPFG